jgi:hypothetical protein
MKSTQEIFANQINKNRILDNIGGALVFGARFNKNGWGGGTYLKRYHISQLFYINKNEL